jgi:hypothetical protein
MASFTTSRRHLVAAGAIAASALAARAAHAGEWIWRHRNRHWDDHDAGDGERHCFREGTLVRTIAGERPIEIIAEGDQLPTRFGEISRVIRRHELGPADRTILITRSALGPDCPARDLYLSAGHALLIDGYLIAAEHLINDRTILRLPPDEAEYFHIELVRHDVIWAEGVLCETLLVEGQRPCAPLVPYRWARGEVASHLRSAFAPVIDLRRPQDIVRDRLAA